jgi:hypothetical protein
VVVGGGPTGATALELGRRGVDCVLVEPRTEVLDVRPRAKTTSIRTMEHFRRWGLAGTLRDAAYLPVDWSQDIVFCVNLLGPEVARFTGYFSLTTKRSELFAETSQQVPQFVVYHVAVDNRRNLTAVFVAPGLAERVPHGPAIQYWVLQPGASAYMGRLDLRDRWWIGLIGVAPGLTDDDVRAHITAAVGGPLEPQLLGPTRGSAVC